MAVRTITRAGRRKAAADTVRITQRGTYRHHNRVVRLPHEWSYEDVEYVPANPGASVPYEAQESAEYILANMDSFGAAGRFAKDTSRTAVHNFASATHPGGGFFDGARAQEESLCRESTLYASLASKGAADFYRQNRSTEGMFYADDMLFSPYVVVIRDESLELLDEPFVTTVFTLAAPNCSYHGRAYGASEEELEEHLEARLRTMFRAAYDRGIKSLVLGAWGCGAFHIDRALVAGTMRRLLADEGWDRCFDTIIFAIRGGEDSENIRTFREVFQDKLEDRIYMDTVTPEFTAG